MARSTNLPTKAEVNALQAKWNSILKNQNLATIKGREVVSRKKQ